MAEKLRIKSLSTRWLLPFKITVFILYCTFFGSIIYLFSTEEGTVGLIFNVGLYGYFFYRILKMSAKIRQVEFDDNYLYVIQGKSDILIPLENIKSVEIKTLGGVYRVDLYFEDILGSYFYFKPSLLYPFNYGSKDALVDLLRTKIKEAKKKRQPLPSMALTS